eukprot:350815-Chlamydomonas_euryale.AAC.4
MKGFPITFVSQHAPKIYPDINGGLQQSKSRLCMHAWTYLEGSTLHLPGGEHPQGLTALGAACSAATKGAPAATAEEPGSNGSRPARQGDGRGAPEHEGSQALGGARVKQFRRNARGERAVGRNVSIWGLKGCRGRDAWCRGTGLPSLQGRFLTRAATSAR